MNAKRIHSKLSDRQQHRTSLENVEDVLSVCPEIPGSDLLTAVADFLDTVAFDHKQNCESDGVLTGDDLHHHERIIGYVYQLRGWL